MTETPISTCAELENLGASTRCIYPLRKIDLIQEQQSVIGNCARMKAIEERALAKSRAKKPATTVATNTRRCQLPPWPDTARGVPNIALRSALFGAIGKGSRRYLERESISALKNTTIIYTGEQLDQGDLDVWVTVLHLARTQPIGQECNITAYEMLQLLQLTDTGPNRKTLESRLSRLTVCALEVLVGPLIHYEGSLINELSRDVSKRRFIIRLTPGLRKVFAKDQFTQIHWAIRQTLNGHYLAQWLHGFYSSHAAPYPLKTETLQKLCGSKTTDHSKFRQLLRKALDALGRASTDHGQPFSYCFEGNLVKIKRTPSDSQQRHLSKR
jgi:hypothetical protein